jgi:hypothetical protein
MKIFLSSIFFPFILSKLLFVNEQFRHGARSSVMDIHPPNFTDYFNIKWEKTGELTNNGIRMIYILGVKDRIKYKNFISNEYNLNEIQFYSSNLNRTIQSAYAHIQGLFFNSSTEKLKNKIQIENAFPPNKKTKEIIYETEKLKFNSLPEKITIAPVHLFDKKDHIFLLHELDEISDCNVIKEKRKKILNSSEKIKKKSIEFLLKYNESLNKMYYENGMNKSKKFDFYFIDVFCDHYISDRYDNKNLNFLEKFGFNLNELEFSCKDVLSFVLENYVFGEDEILFMSQTPIFKQILKNMEKIIYLDNNNNQINVPKYVVYSTHDSSLAGIELFMRKIFGTEYINPDFGCNLYFELHKKDNNNENIYYVNYIVNDNNLLTVDFKEFKSKIENVLWSENDIQKYCKFSIVDKSYVKYQNKLIINCVILSFVYIISLFYMIKIIKNKKNNNNKNNNNNNNKENGKELEDVLVDK